MGWGTSLEVKKLAHAGAIAVGIVGTLGCSSGTSSSQTGGALDAGCSAGRCLAVLASGQLQPGDIGVNTSGVYWTNRGSSVGAYSGGVMRVPLGGGPITVVASGESPYGIAVDSANVYWTDFGDLADGGVLGAVKKSPVAGGAVTALAAGSSGCLGIAVNASSVAWVTSVGEVLTMPLTGGSPTTLATGQSAYAVAVDATSAYWVTYATPGGVVMKAALSGGEPLTLATEQNRAGPIAVRGTRVYWASASATVAAVPSDGGTVTALVSGAADQGDLPFSIAVDDSSVYWTDQARGTVSKVPVEGGSVVMIADGQSAPEAIAVDGTSVYWLNGGDGADAGTVMKATPK